MSPTFSNFISLCFSLFFSLLLSGSLDFSQEITNCKNTENFDNVRSGHKWTHISVRHYFLTNVVFPICLSILRRFLARRNEGALTALPSSQQPSTGINPFPPPLKLKKSTSAVVKLKKLEPGPLKACYSNS